MVLKILSFAFAMSLLTSLSPAAFAADDQPTQPVKPSAQPTQKAAVFDTVYVPNGFDDNDNVQIVGEGMFRNSCYRPAPTTFAVDQATKTVTLSPVAYEYSGLCLQVILPFERVIDVGILPAGTYKIAQSPDGKVLGTFHVGTSRSLSPDDFLYAPISQAFFKEGSAGPQVVLTGDFMSSCMHLDNVKVTVEPNVLVLQPIARNEDRKDCLRGKFPFSKIVNLTNVPGGRYLVHVRSMNGKAVNTIVDVK